MRIRPTYDFIQQLLWNGETIEVLEPKWLRAEMKRRIKEMLKSYRYTETHCVLLRRYNIAKNSFKHFASSENCRTFAAQFARKSVNNG